MNRGKELIGTSLTSFFDIDPDKTYMIRDAINEGEYYGMQSFDQALISLYQQGLITMDDALAMAHNAHDFKIKVRALGVTPGTDLSSGIY